MIPAPILAFARAFVLITQTLRAVPALARPPVRRVFLRQVYFSGLESVAVALFIGAAIGLVLVLQINALVGRNPDLTAQVLVAVLVREVGPLFSGIVLIARSCSAMASELAAMKVNGEIQQLEVGLHIPVRHYLVMPRLLGAVVSITGLSFYLQAGGLLMGALAVRFTGYNEDLPPLLTYMALSDLIWSFIKATVFGLWSAAVACACGLSVGHSMTEIPQAASRAVITALLSVFVLDGVLTALMSLGGGNG